VEISEGDVRRVSVPIERSVSNRPFSTFGPVNEIELLVAAHFPRMGLMRTCSTARSPRHVENIKYSNGDRDLHIHRHSSGCPHRRGYLTRLAETTRQHRSRHRYFELWVFGSSPPPYVKVQTRERFWL